MKRVSGAWMATVKLGAFIRLRRETGKFAADQARRRDALCRRTCSTLKSKERAQLEMMYKLTVAAEGFMNGPGFPHGWVYAALEMDSPRPSSSKVNCKP